MKTTMITLFVLLTALYMVGCEDNNEILIVDEIPQPPQGVYSVTGDGAVYLYWTGPYEDDIESFVIYRSDFDPFDLDYFEIVAIADADPNPTIDLIYYEDFADYTVENGTTYYYRISSVDEAGQESDLSGEDNVYDTPRPEGDVLLYDTASIASSSALIFGEPSIPVAYTNPAADFFIDYFDGRLYINAADINTDIQDMGFTYEFEDIGYAPDTSVGWSTLGFFELLENHTYIFWTRDNHYAKVWVRELTSSSVLLRWAFQTDQGNPEFYQPLFEAQKPVHSATYLKKKITSNNQ